ncbi:hypothetical protein [Rhodococcus sp. 14-2470-1a]|uniref:hypothetical protein n=1 Tax=Rhodococcus sp. 14-2470-1a TaxID=2023150 RepID=UPI00117B1E9D|nr:hypothetical protein [Rhodococcus sp. 14-2470-1a]
MSAAGRRRRRFLLEPERRTPDGVAADAAAVEKAKLARRRARSVLHGCRDLIRAVEDLESMDRLGLLPDATERFSAAAEDLREAVGKLNVALDDVNGVTMNPEAWSMDAYLAAVSKMPTFENPLLTDDSVHTKRVHLDAEVHASPALNAYVPKPGEHLRLGKSHSVGKSAELSDHRAGVNPPAASGGSGPGGGG